MIRVLVLLFSAVVAVLPSSSSAQNVRAETMTRESGVGMGMFSTNDIANVTAFNPIVGVFVAAGSTTNCDRGMNPNIPVTDTRAILAPVNLVQQGSKVETGFRLLVPNGFEQTPAGLTLTCQHNHSATAFQQSIAAATLGGLSGSVSGAGFELKLDFTQNGQPLFVPRDDGVVTVRLTRTTDTSDLMFNFTDDLGRIGEFSPIIFDLGQPGLDLTGLDEPVLFDLNADGKQEVTGWTAAGAEDAFLVFDRNMNGRVDDGMELFGDAVRLPDGSTSVQGYEALAQFDVPSQGGNGNGVVDVGDRNYAKLWLWTDANHNGISEGNELERLIKKGVFAISLDFKTSGEVDEYGNVLAFTAPAFARERGRVTRISTTDVFFRALSTTN